jgi:hypothetical protein
MMIAAAMATMATVEAATITQDFYPRGHRRNYAASGRARPSKSLTEQRQHADVGMSATRSRPRTRRPRGLGRGRANASSRATTLPVSVERPARSQGEK